MKKVKEVIFNTRDELTKVCFSNVMYAESDGNYVMLRLCSGRSLSLLASLQNIEQLVAMDMELRFVRAGRSHLINVDFISQVNTIKRTITLADEVSHNTMVLSISKDAIRQLKNDIAESSGTPVPEFSTHNGMMEAYLVEASK